MFPVTSKLSKSIVQLITRKLFEATAVQKLQRKQNTFFEKTNVAIPSFNLMSCK